MDDMADVSGNGKVVRVGVLGAGGLGKAAALILEKKRLKREGKSQ